MAKKKISCIDCGRLCHIKRCRECYNIARKNRAKLNMIKITCETCRKIKEFNPSAVKNYGGRYCSEKCYNIARKNRAKLNMIKITCELCGKIKEVKICHKNQKYCSDECKHIACNKKIKIVCEVCGKIKEVKLYLKNQKCCSYKCMGIAQITKVKMTCKVCGRIKEFTPSDIKRGNGKYCSMVCRGIATSGENNPRWLGGITPTNHKIRTSKEYKIWRTAVFKRDKYTCLDCGQKGGDLEVHHIKTFSEFPELRFDITNGITFCKKCHNPTKGREQLLVKLLRKILSKRFGYEYI